MSFHEHEIQYRGKSAREVMATFPITLCGVGALGANLADHLARMGFARLTLIDRDRVDARNLSTQPYQRGDVGALKARLMAHTLYRALGIKAKALAQEVTRDNVGRLLAGSGLVVDLFDNGPSRGLVTEWCREFDMPCVHAGMADAYGEVKWNEHYRVPSSARDDICDYPLARSLVMLTVSVAAEVITRYVLTGTKQNYTLTLADLTIREEG